MLVVYWWGFSFMNFVLKKISVFFCACRSYSLPISIMSWLVPFVFASLEQGNRFFGLIALLGIIILHLGSNIFDDAIDYTREQLAINKGLKTRFNFQKDKCLYIFNKELTLKQYYIISFVLFSIALAIGFFFFTIVGAKLFYIIIPAAILCLLYPFLGSLGFGEAVVAIIFSPLLYSGVYLVMKGTYSADILILSISTGCFVIAVLHNHMLMDYKYDEENRKITLCRLCGNEKNALKLLALIIIAAYINLAVWILLNKLSLYYLIPYLSIPFAIYLYKEMSNPDIDFMKKFLLPEKLLSLFNLLLCISIAADKCI